MRSLDLKSCRCALRRIGTLLAALWVGAAAAAEPIPNSMAALGDSITQAATNCGYLVSCPYESWSAGEDPAVNSHYRRILAKNPLINGRNHNFAVSGAEADMLVYQAGLAVYQDVDYITILIGANDACADSEAEMTPVDTFRSEVRSALDLISSGLPNARILVASVPDVYRLWQVAHNDPAAVWVWSQTQVCQNMLKNPTSTKATDEKRRQRVRQRVIDYNTQLAQECALHAHCKFDGNALFNYPFALSELGWDYFHPGIPGQAKFASTTYQAGFNW
ncbi:MAG TPA: SGNH/GDSL hydrolase family protein [Solimonas sp.]|nr:SGNH/GDSL hydrolase family protein [Solimonas sp.]